MNSKEDSEVAATRGSLTREENVSCYYNAFCSECGWIGKTGDRRWMDPFFMPGRCERCHDYKSRYAYSMEEARWTVSYGYWRFIPDDVQKPKVWFLPWTWGQSGKEVWFDWDENAVLSFPVTK